MRTLRYVASSRQDIRDIAEFILQETASRQLAIGLVTRLREQCQKLAALPGTLGRARPDIGTDIRSFPWKGYVIFIRYGDTTLDVLHILHASRDVIAYFGDDAGM